MYFFLQKYVIYVSTYWNFQMTCWLNLLKLNLIRMNNVFAYVYDVNLLWRNKFMYLNNCLSEQIYNMSTDFLQRQLKTTLDLSSNNVCQNNWFTQKDQPTNGEDIYNDCQSTIVFINSYARPTLTYQYKVHRLLLD